MKQQGSAIRPPEATEPLPVSVHVGPITAAFVDAPVVRTVSDTPNVVIARLRGRLNYYAKNIENAADELASGTASNTVADQLRRDAEAMRRAAK